MAPLLLNQPQRPTLIVSDVHGSLNWKTIVAGRRAGERLIFLGDYFDRRGKGPFAASDAENFLEICEYSRSHADTYMLMGNHDYDCLPFSGMAWLAWSRESRENREALMANLDLLNMVYLDENGLIFSHGGLTATFMKLNGLEKPAEVNELWAFKPEAFEFQTADPASGQRSDRYGDDPWQSPIWARTGALMQDALPGHDQVVGHTPVRKPEIMATIHGERVLLTCTLDATAIRLGGAK